jgi:tetratricopeptide (TPR) repeat protein
MRWALLFPMLFAGCMFNPGAAQQALMEANMRSLQKDYVTAISYCDQALLQDPTLREAYLARGIAYRCRGNYDRALADLDRAIEFGLDGPRAFAERARTKLERLAADAAGDTAKLAAGFAADDPLHIGADLDTAAKLDPLYMDATTMLLRGAVRLMQNRDADAQQDFERYLRHRPKTRNDLDYAIEKWKKDRPVLDLSPIDDLARVAARSKGS